MKGLRAELDTGDTPRMACKFNIYQVNSMGLFNSHLNNLARSLCTQQVRNNLLSDKLLHHVGQVGEDEGDHNGYGEVGGLKLGP